MSRDDRLAIVVSPAASGLRGEQGELDGDAIKERLAQDDAAFDVVTLDASVDLAEQLESLFDERGETARSTLFYASTDVRAVGDEFFLCLDPSEPEVCDSLADVAATIAERGTGPILILIDARYPPSDDPAEGAEMIRVARNAVKALDQGIELVIAARPASQEPVDACSPFTRAILEVLDASDPTSGLSAVEIYDALGENEEAIASLRSFAHLDCGESFMVIPGRVDIQVDDAAPESVTDVMDGVPREGTPSPADATPIASPAVAEPEVAAPPEPPVERQPATAERAVVTDPKAEEPAEAKAPAASSTEVDRAPMVEPPQSIRGASFFPPPSQPDARALIDEARTLVRKSDFDGALGVYRRVLGLGNLAKDIRGHVYLRMGMLKALQAKIAEAIAHFEKALTLVDAVDVPKVLGELLTLYLAEKDFRAGMATQEKILKLLPTEEERFEALLRFGIGWVALPEEKLRARQMLERAERIHPDHRELLVMLKNLGEAEGRIEEVLRFRARIAEATTDPVERSGLLAELARDLAKKGREDEAVQLYEKALDAEPSRLDALAGISELHSERQEWSELEASYRRMFARLPRIGDSARAMVEWELARRLGLLLRDHLDDAKGALEAFERATAARPLDSTVRKLAADAARGADDPEALERHLLVLATLEPRDARVFHFLFDGFMKTGEVERATDAAAVLVALSAASDRERVVFEANRPRDVPKLLSPVDPSGWSLLRHRDPEIALVNRIFATGGPAVVAALAEVVASTHASRLPDPKLKVDPGASTISAVRTLAFASKSLGLSTPDIYLDEKHDGSFSIVLAEPPASRVGALALRGRSLAELMFLAGRHLTYHAPEHRLLALCPALDDFTGCFLAMVAVVTGEASGPTSVRRVIADLAERVDAWLGADDKDALAAAVEEFTKSGGRVDLTRFVASVERTSLRVGLLLAGDLATAVAGSNEGLFGSGYRDQLAPEARVDELLAFSVSAEYADVRALTLGETQSEEEQATA